MRAIVQRALKQEVQSNNNDVLCDPMPSAILHVREKIQVVYRVATF
jgi:hypothetical protein